jgi:ribosomal-protein-alanine N-acetyltransferase
MRGPAAPRAGRPLLRLEDDGTAIRALAEADAGALLGLRLANRRRLGAVEPLRPPSFFTAAGQQDAVRWLRRAWRDGTRYGFVILAGDDVVGGLTVDNVARGAWQNATLGYWLDAAAEGHGHATRAVGLAARFAFEDVGLHRLQAAVLVTNVRSAAVLRRAGFRLEGRAERYLCIAGRWEDHDLYARTVEDRPPDVRRALGARVG